MDLVSNIVIPSGARDLLFACLRRKQIPHFVRNDKSEARSHAPKEDRSFKRRRRGSSDHPITAITRSIRKDAYERKTRFMDALADSALEKFSTCVGDEPG